MSYQLAAHIRIKGEAPWTQQQITELLLQITSEIYEDEENHQDGFTGAAIVQLCRELGFPVHIKWQGSKIARSTPERAEYEAVALYTWGDHLYTVDDASL